MRRDPASVHVPAASPPGSNSTALSSPAPSAPVAGSWPSCRQAPAPTLEASYRRCRELNRAHGSTYYWSTRLLPTVKRHHVHALYGFCRYADDIVDDLGTAPLAQREAALRAYGERFLSDLEAGCSDDLVLKAVVHTARAFDLPREGFRRFLRSMAMDLSVTSYARFEDLRDYMDGSAAVIGELMLPILEPAGPAAFGAARDLGIAFQLTNFLRDVGEDLARGRVYLPQEDLTAFDAHRALELRRVTSGWVALCRFEIDRIRGYYRSADEGIAHLPPVSARCIVAARTLYAGILDRIEEMGYDVFSQRARVATWRKVAAGVRLVSRPG